MTADVELLPLHLLEAFSAALKGERGELDAWLEVNNEADVRLHVEAYARAVAEHNVKERDAEIEALRAEVAWQKRVKSAHAELHREAKEHAERLAEALRELVALGHPRDPAIIAARAALRDHDKEKKDAT